MESQTPSELCWICGEPGIRKMLTGFECVRCEVEWSMRPPWSPYASQEEADKCQAELVRRQQSDYRFTEYVDFTKEDAPHCPA